LTRLLRPRVVLALGLAVLAAVGASALAAANVVDATKAGDGQAAVTGYSVTPIHYNLNATSPFNIDSVVFDVNTAPVAGSTMKIKLVAAGTTWYACTNAGVTLTCPTTAPQATVLAADELRVVIAQ